MSVMSNKRPIFNRINYKPKELADYETMLKMCRGPLLQHVFKRHTENGQLILMTRSEYILWATNRYFEWRLKEEERKYYQGFAYRSPEQRFKDTYKVKCYGGDGNEAEVNLPSYAAEFVYRPPSSGSSIAQDAVPPEYGSGRYASGKLASDAYFKLTTPQEVPMNIPKNAYVLLCLSGESPRFLYPKMDDAGDVKFATYHDEIPGDFIYDRNDISSDELRPLAAKYHAVFICKLVDLVHFEMKSLMKE